MKLTTDKPASLLATMLASLKQTALDARAEIEQLDAQLVKLRARRAELENALPHADDLAAWLCRNIERHRDFFFERAATYLYPEVVRERGWAALDAPEIWHEGFAVFRLDNSADGRWKGFLSPRDSNEARGTPIDARALVALLAEPLKAAARDFIVRLLPETVDGMRRAERERALEELDAEIRALADQRQTILDELRQAGGAAK